ncbi:MAG: site-specific integrase [Pseudomonadota bacterium]
MGNITMQPRSDGTVAYQVQIRIKHAPRITKTLDTMELAKEFERETEADIRRQLKLKGTLSAFDMSDPDASFRKERVDGIVTAFLVAKMAEYKAAKEALRRNGMGKGFTGARGEHPWYEFHGRTVAVEVRDATVGQLRQRWARDYITRMLGTKTPVGRPYTFSTISRQLSIVRQAVAWRAEELNVDPIAQFFFSKTMFPRKWQTKRDLRLSKAQEFALMARFRQIRSFYPSRPHWRLITKLALETGARLQELRLAEFSEIQDRTDGQYWVIPAEHTKAKEERTVPLSAAARRIVRILRRMKSPDSEEMFHFLGPENCVSVGFRNFCKLAGLPQHTFHDLRHEAISRMCTGKSEIQVLAIQRIVGHKGEDMLQRYYHPTDGELIRMMG